MWRDSLTLGENGQDYKKYKMLHCETGEVNGNLIIEFMTKQLITSQSSLYPQVLDQVSLFNIYGKTGICNQ